MKINVGLQSNAAFAKPVMQLESWISSSFESNNLRCLAARSASRVIQGIEEAQRFAASGRARHAVHPRKRFLAFENELWTLVWGGWTAAVTNDYRDSASYAL
jgi:hypothetical protein